MKKNTIIGTAIAGAIGLVAAGLAGAKLLKKRGNEDEDFIEVETEEESDSEDEDEE